MIIAISCVVIAAAIVTFVTGAICLTVTDVAVRKMEKEEEEKEIFRSKPENAGFEDKYQKADFEYIFPEFAENNKQNVLPQVERTEVNLTNENNDQSNNNDISR